MVLNKKIVKDFLRYNIKDAPSYDWILYIFATFKKYKIYYDVKPRIFYRQHKKNYIGSNLGIINQCKRFFWTIKGRFKKWNNFNEKIILKFYKHGNAETQKKFHIFQNSRKSRLIYLKLLISKKFPFYRQTFLGDLFLKISLAIKLL